MKPTLKKVSKYENKFAKLQKKAAEFNFRNQLKQVKKKEFTLEEEDKEVRQFQIFLWPVKMNFSRLNFSWNDVESIELNETFSVRFIFNLFFNGIIYFSIFIWHQRKVFFLKKKTVQFKRRIFTNWCFSWRFEFCAFPLPTAFLFVKWHFPRVFIPFWINSLPDGNVFF